MALGSARRSPTGRPDYLGATKSGYSPACANEWRAGVCEKPRINCGDCSNRMLIPLSDSVIFDHLAGEHTVGVYPLLEDDTCYFLSIDFDEAEWREDARAFVQSCSELGVPVTLEISRSGKGATLGYFSLAGYRPAMPVAWARPSSATPAREPGRDANQKPRLGHVVTWPRFARRQFMNRAR